MNRTQCNVLLVLFGVFAYLPSSLLYRAKHNVSINAHDPTNNKSSKSSGMGLLTKVAVSGPSAIAQKLSSRRATSPKASAKRSASRGKLKEPVKSRLRWVFFDYDETMTITSNVPRPEFETATDLFQNKKYLWFLLGGHDEILPKKKTNPKGLPGRVDDLRGLLERLQRERIKTAILSNHRVFEGGKAASGMDSLVAHLRAVELLAQFDEIWVLSETLTGYDKWENGWPKNKGTAKNFVQASSKQDAMIEIAKLQGGYQLMVLVDDLEKNLKDMKDAKTLGTLKEGQSRNGIYGFQVAVNTDRDLVAQYLDSAFDHDLSMELDGLAGFAAAEGSMDFEQLRNVFA